MAHMADTYGRTFIIRILVIGIHTSMGIYSCLNIQFPLEIERTQRGTEIRVSEYGNNVKKSTSRLDQHEEQLSTKISRNMDNIQMLN